MPPETAAAEARSPLLGSGGIRPAAAPNPAARPDADWTGLAAQRTRVVLTPRPPEGPRIHPDYRALLASPLHLPDPAPVSGAVAVLAATTALVVAVLLIALIGVLV